MARARPVTGDHVLSILGLIQRRIPMRHPPRLLESAEVSAPVAAGVIGNYVLLPTGWAGSLRHGETLAVLCHESAHLARRDHRVVILQELLASALWFHPLVHLFNRMLNRVREEVCDNHAIAVVDRASYCEALLLLAVGRPGASPRGATSMWTRHWSLEDRVRGILDERRPTRTRISGVARSATATFSLAICGLIAMPQLTASQPNDRIATAAEADSPPRAKAGPVANEMTRSIIRSFPVNGEKMLRFENLAGRVELVPGNGPTVEVEAIVRVSELAEGEVKTPDRRHPMGRSAGRGRRVPMGPVASRKDDTRRSGIPSRVKRRPTSRPVRHLGREVRLSNRRGESIPSVEFDLRISLPPGVRVAVDNAVGPIDGESVDSPLKLSTRHGVIKLGDVRAPVDATSEFGDVLISRLERRRGRPHGQRRHRALAGHSRPRDPLHTLRPLPDRSTARVRLQAAIFRSPSARSGRRWRVAHFGPERRSKVRNCSRAGRADRRSPSPRTPETPSSKPARRPAPSDFQTQTVAFDPPGGGRASVRSAFRKDEQNMWMRSAPYAGSPHSRACSPRLVLADGAGADDVGGGRGRGSQPARSPAG